MSSFNFGPPDRRHGRHSLFGPTIGDTLVGNAWGCKLELCRIPDENGDASELSIDFELKGSIDSDADPAGVLASLIAAMQGPRGGEEGVA